MKISMYTLLGMIKDGKAPKKIKVYGKVYINNGCNCYLDENDNSLCNNVEIPMYLYDEVEIIEESQEHKIPEKLDLGDYTEITSKNDMEYKMFEYIFNKNANAFYNKINEILDYLEEIE